MRFISTILEALETRTTMSGHPARRYLQRAGMAGLIIGMLFAANFVVVADELGICDELEEEMQHFVDAHVDEWVATLAAPAELARFRSFINAPEEPDPLLARVPERGQSRPATLEERREVLISGARIEVRDAHGHPVPC